MKNSLKNDRRYWALIGFVVLILLAVTVTMENFEEKVREADQAEYKRDLENAMEQKNAAYADEQKLLYAQDLHEFIVGMELEKVSGQRLWDHHLSAANHPSAFSDATFTSSYVEELRKMRTHFWNDEQNQVEATDSLAAVDAARAEVRALGTGYVELMLEVIKEEGNGFDEAELQLQEFVLAVDHLNGEIHEEFGEE